MSHVKIFASKVRYIGQKGQSMEIYERIDGVIEDGDTAIKDLAIVLDVDRRTITRWRKGNIPEMGIYKLAALCKHYNVSADYILGLPKNLTWPR